LRNVSSFFAAGSPSLILFRQSLSCSGVRGDKKVFKTHLKNFIDTFYVLARFSVLFPFYFPVFSKAPEKFQELGACHGIFFLYNDVVNKFC